MKICMISDYYWPDTIGGTETNLQTISEALTINNDVIVICTRQDNELDYIKEINGVKVYRIDTDNIYSIFDSANKPLYLKLFWHLRSLINRQSCFDVKEILKKDGFWDEVSTLNIWGLANKLEKHEFPQELEEILKKYASTEETTRLTLSKIKEND